MNEGMRECFNMWMGEYFNFQINV